MGSECKTKNRISWDEKVEIVNIRDLDRLVRKKHKKRWICRLFKPASGVSGTRGDDKKVGIWWKNAW